MAMPSREQNPGPAHPKQDADSALGGIELAVLLRLVLAYRSSVVLDSGCATAEVLRSQASSVWATLTSWLLHLT